MQTLSNINDLRVGDIILSSSKPGVYCYWEILKVQKKTSKLPACVTMWALASHNKSVIGCTHEFYYLNTNGNIKILNR